MDKVKISEIENSKDKFLHLDIEDSLLEPQADLKASLDITPLGDFISVKGHVEGVAKLTCDLCLKEFDYKLDFDVDEMYAKNSVYDGEKQEIEIKDGQFVIDLNGSDEIDIYDLLYQSVILELPNKKVCGINCKEDFFEKDDSFRVHDERMDIFKTIKIEK